MDTWFLCETNQFKNRKLLIGKCPVCQKNIAKLIETRIIDEKVFVQTFFGKNSIEKLCEKLNHQVIITAQQITIKKNSPFGFCFGVNKEIHNNKGQLILTRQKRCDWYNQLETVKNIIHKSPSDGRNP